MRPDGRWGRLLCRADDFDLVLVVEMENTDVIVLNRERYDDFLRFYGQENIDPGNETVLAVITQSPPGGRPE